MGGDERAWDESRGVKKLRFLQGMSLMKLTHWVVSPVLFLVLVDALSVTLPACGADTVFPGISGVALVPTINFDGSDTMFNSMLDTVTAAGVKGNYTLYTWGGAGGLETPALTYNLNGLKYGAASLANLGDTRGLNLFISISVLNTTIRNVPTDLAATPFTDPAMKTRFHQLIDTIVPLFNSHIAYLAIGNEVDVYMHVPAVASDTWSTYKNFYDDAVAYVHQKAPGVKVGVIATFDGWNGADQAGIQSLNSSSDVIMLTYHPLANSTTYTMRPASTASSDVQRMTVLANGKPVVLSEVGYSSAATSASSETQYSDFVTQFITAWQGGGSAAIPFASFYTLHDFTDTDCADQAAGYGQPGNAALIGYLCSTGLRKTDETAKLPWQAFVTGLAGWAPAITVAGNAGIKPVKSQTVLTTASPTLTDTPPVSDTNLMTQVSLALSSAAKVAVGSLSSSFTTPTYSVTAPLGNRFGDTLEIRINSTSPGAALYIRRFEDTTPSGGNNSWDTDVFGGIPDTQMSILMEASVVLRAGDTAGVVYAEDQSFFDTLGVELRFTYTPEMLNRMNRNGIDTHNLTCWSAKLNSDGKLTTANDFSQIGHTANTVNHSTNSLTVVCNPLTHFSAVVGAPAINSSSAGPSGGICVLGRRMGRGSWMAALLRETRDSMLSSKNGRVLVSIYYNLK